jgi:hypothetical protein
MMRQQQQLLRDESSSSSSLNPRARPQRPLELVRDNETRWNSSHAMVQRFLEVLRALQELQAFESFKQVTQSGLDDRALFKELVTKHSHALLALVAQLEPLQNITVASQSEYFAILCHLPHWIDVLQRQLEELATSDGVKAAAEAVQSMLDDIARRKKFGDLLNTTSLPLRAAALTPHYASLDFGSADDALRDPIWKQLEHDAHAVVPVQHSDHLNAEIASLEALESGPLSDAMCTYAESAGTESASDTTNTL